MTTYFSYQNNTAPLLLGHGRGPPVRIRHSSTSTAWSGRCRCRRPDQPRGADRRSRGRQHRARRWRHPSRPLGAFYGRTLIHAPLRTRRHRRATRQSAARRTGEERRRSPGPAAGIATAVDTRHCGTSIKEQAIEQAAHTGEALAAALASAQSRKGYYDGLIATGLNPQEWANFVALTGAAAANIAAIATRHAAAVAYLVPGRLAVRHDLRRPADRQRPVLGVGGLGRGYHRWDHRRAARSHFSPV